MEMFNRIIVKDEGKYFLFCGSAAYIEVLEFVIKSFELIENIEIKLQLICFGSKSEINILKIKISQSKKADLIVLSSDMDYTKLICYYKKALALLIPLRSTQQDQARFPHKVGEYAASGKPIISNKFGEMGFYFIDEKSALLAEKYEYIDFANKMKFVICNPEKANQIGINGRIVADTYFDYKKFGGKLASFLENIKN